VRFFINISIGQRNPADTPVEEIYRAGVCTCRPEESLVDAIARMGENGVRRLVVIDADGEPCGILSLEDAAPESDVAAALAQTNST